MGQHPKITKITSFLPDIAESESPVIIEGPTGSGKELIARAIHQLSPRSRGPFIAVNCAALPDTLLESELFGYRRGAFTGANRDKPGRLQLADKGTLFLDEISSTSRQFQADLLRILEDSKITPLGSTTSFKVDIRIVAASNADLSQLILKNAFRRELYYRLNVVKISLPALQEEKTGHSSAGGSLYPPIQSAQGARHQRRQSRRPCIFIGLPFSRQHQRIGKYYRICLHHMQRERNRHPTSAK
ncbi:MAG: sigma-54 factor interaction domain-containing protein [Deltaproteobacteria bacterium]|nr:sigma-54 factor interaction domain-containing protein [Deltaproteobacteria bacterium]